MSLFVEDRLVDHEDESSQGEAAWIDRVVDHIKGGNHVVGFGQSLGGIQALEAHAIGNPGLLCLQGGLRNERLEEVVPHVPRGGVALCQLDEGVPPATAHIGHQSTLHKVSLDGWHRRDSHRHEQVLARSSTCSCHALPVVAAIGGLRDTASLPERLEQSMALL